MKKYQRQKYNFALGAAEEYEAFLRKYFMRTSPNFYGIIRSNPIETIDGEMFELRLTVTVDDPSLDVIAECVINNQLIYLWHDHCWTLAQDDQGIMQLWIVGDNPCGEIPLGTPRFYDAARKNKEIVIYRIGDVPDDES